MVRKPFTLLLAVVALIGLAACSSTQTSNQASNENGAGTPAPTSSDAWGDPAAAAPADKVGPGTACPTSLAFDIPEKWKPIKIDLDPELNMFGAFEPVCEIDAKPAGIIGFLRIYVWAGAKDGSDGSDSTDADNDLGAVAEAFVKDLAPSASNVGRRDMTVAGAQGLELRYRSNDHENRAFVVRLGDTTYVVEWGGFDQQEHEAGLPAYVLARNSARAA